MMIIGEFLESWSTRLNTDRLVRHTTLIGVVAHFDVADHRKVLAERVPYEAVVGKNATQIGMT